MKITSIAEANKSLSAARADLVRCHWARSLRDAPPTVYNLTDRQELIKFYLSQWPQHARDAKHRQLWSDELDMCIENIEAYIKNVETWKQSRLNKPQRSCLSKKQQREQGILPSVEAQRTIQGRP